jgi:FkbM family methyltransferase
MAIRRVLGQLGLMPAARRVAREWRKRFASAKTRRDIRDDEQLDQLLSRLLTPESNCVDIGAHVGDRIGDILRYAPRGHHIAYEPLPEFAAKLAARYPQVEVRAVALSDHRGTATFQYVKTRPSHSGLRERGYPGGPQEIETIEVPVEDLDSSLPDGFVPALIKIDVEGAELEVLRGALGTITEHRPVIVFEHERDAAPHYGTSPSDVHRLLCEQAHMRIFDLDGGGPYSLSRFERTFADGSYINFVACP